MLASKLVAGLNQLIKQHGDQPVVLFDSYLDPSPETIDVRGAVVGMSDDDKPDHFLIADEDTFDAFIDD